MARTPEEENEIETAAEVRRRAARLIRQDVRCESGEHAALKEDKTCSHCGAKVEPKPETKPVRRHF
jgi:hypothetical protein